MSGVTFCSDSRHTLLAGWRSPACLFVRLKAHRSRKRLEQGRWLCLNPLYFLNHSRAESGMNDEVLCFYVD